MSGNMEIIQVTQKFAMYAYQITDEDEWKMKESLSVYMKNKKIVLIFFITSKCLLILAINHIE